LPVVAALAATSLIAAAVILWGVRSGDGPRGVAAPRTMPAASPSAADDATVRDAVDAGPGVARPDAGASLGAPEAGASSRPASPTARRPPPLRPGLKNQDKKPRRKQTRRRKQIGDGIMDL
jgi:hypothetical protein